MGMRVVYEIIEGTMDNHGQILINPGWSDDDVFASYHAHGECVQYHSKLKTDMDVERLPSGNFATKALVLEPSIIAFNLLRMIGQGSIKHKQPVKRKVRRRSLRTVIENSMLCVSHFMKLRAV